MFNSFWFHEAAGWIYFMINGVDNDTPNDTQTIPQVYPIHMIHVIRNGLHYTSIWHVLVSMHFFWQSWSFHDLCCTLEKGNAIPIMTFYEAEFCQEIAPSKTIKKRYTKQCLRFRFARHPRFRTSMTSLLLLLLALACAGHQLCGCLCWRCWWCLCCSWWCKNLGKRPRAALRKSGLSAAESSVVTTLTEHRWRVAERSADVVEEALAEAMFCVVRNV